MSNEDVKFSELPVGTLASDSIFATSENDGNGGLISTGVSAADVGNFAIDNLQYPLKLNTENKKVAGAINELHAINGYSYDAYDDTSTYAAGDLCIYNNTLYKCTTAITTAEAWNASHWTATSIADEIGRIDTALSGKTDNTISALTIESNTKISNQGIHFLLFGKIITLSGLFRAQNTQIMAQETIWTIKNHNLGGQSTDQYYIPVIVDGEQGYFYLVAQNDGNDIKIFSNINVQMPKLMFFNGVLPIV